MYITNGQALNALINVGSAIACILLMLVRVPGIDMFGIGPNWPVIWLVAWSLRRSLPQAIIAGLVMGFLSDSISAPQPSHAVPLVIAAVITFVLSKLLLKNIQEDFISVAMIVFGMAIIVEMIRSLQFSQWGLGTITNDLADIWSDRQKIALSSAILSSLLAPVVYFPLSRWWKFHQKHHQIPSLRNRSRV
ncbi:MAG: rod shape-determining protein MreD [Arthrospira sp. PLM2.Bin9]|nr:rod shape-determining protein MreD [Arthrospira sp. PLM2.Bin9]TVU54538.1 MAG: rod shape-determining protein MreD [Arthrospira sp. PLM2.Bin9]